MTNYDIHPLDSDLPGVRLYGDSLEPLTRNQTHVAERHSVIEGATPSSDSDGIQPGDVTFQGTWLGADAAALADRLREILDDPSVTRVQVDGVDESGTSVNTPYDGEYRIADQTAVEQTVPGRDEAWDYGITLIED